MLRIRLQRLGKKKQPTYRFVVSEKQKDTQSGTLEILGEYNPIRVEKVINLKEDRIKYWISVGAQPSATVNNILVNAGVIEGKKAKSVTITNKRTAKLEKKKVENTEKAEAKKAAAKEAAEAKKAEEKAAKEAAKAEAEAAKAAKAEAEKAEKEKVEAPVEEKATEEKSEAEAPAEEKVAEEKAAE